MWPQFFIFDIGMKILTSQGCWEDLKEVKYVKVTSIVSGAQNVLSKHLLAFMLSKPCMPLSTYTLSK